MGSFEPKVWQNDESGGTPVGATSLIDLETRLSAYSDVVGVSSCTFSWPGVLLTGQGGGFFTFPFDADIVSVWVSVSLAPVGSDIVVDVNKNGTTLFTVQENRPRIPDGDTFPPGGGAIPALNSVVAGDRVGIDVDQVGSSTPGSDLVVVLAYRPVLVV